VKCEGYRRTLIESTSVGPYIFNVYDADPYVSVEVSLGDRIVERALVSDNEGPEWERLKTRYETTKI